MKSRCIGVKVLNAVVGWWKVCSLVLTIACCGRDLSGEIFGFSLPMNYGFLILNH